MNDVIFKDLLTAKSPTQIISLGIQLSFGNIPGTDKTLKEVLKNSTNHRGANLKTSRGRYRTILFGTTEVDDLMFLGPDF